MPRLKRIKYERLYFPDKVDRWGLSEFGRHICTSDSLGAN